MTTSVPVDHRTSTRSPLPALAGVGALAASAGAIAVLGDPLRGASTAQEAATALAGSSAQGAAVLGGAYALLGISVAGSLAARLARGADTGATRLIPVLGAAHLVLMTLFLAAPAAAVTVGTVILDGGVGPVGAESALVIMNVLHAPAEWLGAGFLIAAAVAARPVSRAVAIASAVLAVGLLLPPVAWLVSYLLGVWFAGVGIWLWRRG